MKKNKKQIEKHLDELWRRAVLKHWNYRCAVCGSEKSLQAAHIFSRRHRKIRWDPENGVCLCLRHHLYWAHQEPVQFYIFLKNRLGEDFLNELMKKSQEIAQYSIEDLEEIGKRLEDYVRED